MAGLVRMVFALERWVGERVGDRQESCGFECCGEGVVEGVEGDVPV